MKVILLDRDGTVIADPPDERVDSEDKIKLFSDTIDALRELSKNGFAVIFITNQAGISEDRLTEKDFWRIHEAVLDKLSSSGIKVLHTYICPHGPGDGCTCRKPRPTLILQAAKDYNFKLEQTYMIGDRPSDIGAAIAAGAKAILVQTANVKVEAPEATYTAKTLLEAAKLAVINS